MTQEFEAAKEHLAWLKKTAADKQDLARVVGYEDCLREWQASRESLKAKLLSDEMVAIISLALATHAEETTANIFGKPTDTATFKSTCQNISYMYESAAKAALEAVVGEL